MLLHLLACSTPQSFASGSSGTVIGTGGDGATKSNASRLLDAMMPITERSYRPSSAQLMHNVSVRVFESTPERHARGLQCESHWAAHLNAPTTMTISYTTKVILQTFDNLTPGAR